MPNRGTMKSGEMGDSGSMDSVPGTSKTDRAYKGYKGGVSAGNRWDGELKGDSFPTKQTKQGRSPAPDLS